MRTLPWNCCPWRFPLRPGATPYPSRDLHPLASFLEFGLALRKRAAYLGIVLHSVPHPTLELSVLLAQRVKLGKPTLELGVLLAQRVELGEVLDGLLLGRRQFVAFLLDRNKTVAEGGHHFSDTASDDAFGKVLARGYGVEHSLAIFLETFAVLDPLPKLLLALAELVSEPVRFLRRVLPLAQAGAERGPGAAVIALKHFEPLLVLLGLGHELSPLVL